MMEWEDKPSSDKCIDSPTKLKRKKDQLDLLQQLKLKQETLAIQKFNKQNGLLRKERNRLKTTINSPSPKQLQKRCSLENDMDEQEEKMRQKSEQQEEQVQIENTSSSQMKIFNGLSPKPRLSNTKVQNNQPFEESEPVIGTRIKSLTNPPMMYNNLNIRSNQKSKSIQQSYKHQITSDNDSTDPFQKLGMGDEDYDNFNNFDDEYFKKKEAIQKKKEIKEEIEIDYDYFSNKQLIVRDSKRKNTKTKQQNQRNLTPIQIQDEQEMKPPKQNRLSYQLNHENEEFSNRGSKKRMLTLISTNSNNQYNEESTRETSLKEIPSLQSILHTQQQAKQFVIKTNKLTTLKTSKSLQPGSPNNTSDQYPQIGSFSNKSSRKTSDKIDHFSELYQIVENQYDANEKSSENQSSIQSEGEENNKLQLKNKKSNQNSLQNSSISSIPLRGIQKHSSGMYSTSTSGSDSLYSKPSLNNIINHNYDKEGVESAKIDSIQEFQSNSKNSSPSARKSIREQLKLRKKQTLEYLDDSFYQRSFKTQLNEYGNEKQEEDYVEPIVNNQNNYNDNEEIYSPLEKIALKSARNISTKQVSRKSTLTQQFLGNVPISASSNSIISIQKRQKTLINQQSSNFYRRNSEKRESIFSLFSYEEMLVRKLYEFLQNNNKLQKMIETVSNTDIYKFGKQCEMVISSTIHDDIHGKIQKIIADSNLKERISDYFYQCLKTSRFDEQTLQIFSSQFSMKWHKFFTNSNLLEDMGGVDQIKLIVWKCLQKLKGKLSFSLNAGACSRACIRFFASLLTDNQSAIAYYMTKLSENVIVTQLDFFLIKTSLYKALYQLSILDQGDLDFIMEKLENCRSYLFPEEFLRSNELVRFIAETFYKNNKIFQNSQNQYFHTNDYSLALQIIETIIKLINYEINIDDCIQVLTPLCQKPLDDNFFTELLKILRIYLLPLDCQIMLHVNHLMNRLKMKLNQQHSAFPFNSCLLEIEQNELFEDMEEWLEDYFKNDDLNNLTDIFNFKYMKFILTFAMDQREIFQIQDSICAKNVYKPTPEAIKYQTRALRSVIQTKLDKNYEKFQSRRSLKLGQSFSSQNFLFGKNLTHSSLFELSNKQPSIVFNQASSSSSQGGTLDQIEPELDEKERKRRLQYKQIEILFNYLRSCTEI